MKVKSESEKKKIKCELRYDSTNLCILGLDDNIESLEPLVTVRGAPLEVD